MGNEEAVENEVLDTQTDNSDVGNQQEPDNNSDNSQDDNQNQEPENNKSNTETKSKFATLEEATKGYSELEKKLGQQSNELGELRKQAQKAAELEEKFAKMQLQEANDNGFETVAAYQNSKELANFTADKYAEHIRECEFPDEMQRLLEEYRRNPNDELLDTIESQFSVDTIKKVAGQNELYKGQLQEKENEALRNEIELSAKNYLNESVGKYVDDFKNPAFAALYGEAFRAYGCDLDTDKFVALMRQYADSVIKANGIKKGIAQENANETDEMAGLHSSGGAKGSGSGKSLTELSDKELDDRLSQLI